MSDVVGMDVATSAGDGDGRLDEVADASVDGDVMTVKGSYWFMVNTANCYCFWTMTTIAYFGVCVCTVCWSSCKGSFLARCT